MAERLLVPSPPFGPWQRLRSFQCIPGKNGKGLFGVTNQKSVSFSCEDPCHTSMLRLETNCYKKQRKSSWKYSLLFLATLAA